MVLEAAPHDFMLALGVSDAAGWAGAALARPSPLSDEQIWERRKNLANITAMADGGRRISQSLLEDDELLITGRMSFAEHRAYLFQKYAVEGGR